MRLMYFITLVLGKMATNSAKEPKCVYDQGSRDEDGRPGTDSDGGL